MMHDTFGPDLGWILLVLTVWLAAIGGAVALAVHAIRKPPVRSASELRPRSARELPSPLDILERRFAAGEITREDFDEARARLREHELDL